MVAVALSRQLAVPLDRRRVDARERCPTRSSAASGSIERKEIKDALAYMKLVINPHDDVSLRRVINVPARGIGKGVMDTLHAVDPEAVFADAPR